MRMYLRIRTATVEERSVVLYNNAYDSTSGTIRVSAASMDKGSGELRQRTLSEGLALPGGYDDILAFRDHARGLDFLRRGSDLRDHGLYLELRGYQYAVLLDWRNLRSTAEQPWDRLCDALNGGGVADLYQALTRAPLPAAACGAAARVEPRTDNGLCGRCAGSCTGQANNGWPGDTVKLQASASARTETARAQTGSRRSGQDRWNCGWEHRWECGWEVLRGRGPVLESTTGGR